MGFTSSAQLDNVDFPDLDSMMDHFTNDVVQAATMNIPRSSIRPRRVPVPWWTDECHDAIRARKRALKQFQIQLIQENLVSFKRLRAAAPGTIRSAKRRSWEATSSLCPVQHRRTSYDVRRRMSGKCRITTVSGLSVNGVAITSQCDVANALAASFASASSSDRYDPTFLSIEDNAETSPLHFNSQNLERYDAPFSMDQLLSIGRSRNTSPGPDAIHNQMLSHISPSAKEFLLSLFNTIWDEHCFPSSCREGIVIPILYPRLGKIALSHPTIVQSASLPVFAKQWNAWSTTALSLSWRRKTC
jgi:hypothetical protein